MRRMEPLPAAMASFVAGLAVATLTTPAGVSGAFLMVPFQMVVLGLAGPSVSATNLMFNVIATPAGVYAYNREGRIDRALTSLVLQGTLPGVAVGAYLRANWLADPDRFKILIALVLIPLGVRLGIEAARTSNSTVQNGYRRSQVLPIAITVGVIGGSYGIGGGAIIAPFLVSVLRLSPRAVAGPALLATFTASVVGVAAYGALGTLPNFAVAIPMGLGGLLGGYLGAKLQKRIADRYIRLLLAVLSLSIGIAYAASLV